MDSLTILVVNNHGQFNHLIHRAIRDMGHDSRLVPNTLTPEEIMGNEPDGLILGGGPDISRRGNCDSYLNKLELPVLGICLGHQVMALNFGGDVGTGQVGGYANIDIDVLKPENILAGLPCRFSVWASHADDVSRAPEDFEVMAKSDICEVEAMCHSELPLFGVQWHPEVSHTEHGLEIFGNFIDICRDRC
jgi:GMP synthase (glutamine-hydrolysing)